MLPAVLDTLQTKVQVTRTGDALSAVLATGESYDAWLSRLAEAVGTADTEIAEFTLRMLASGLGRSDDTTLNAILAQMQEMKPRDAVERCLIIQMLLTAHKSVQALSASNLTISPEELEKKLASALRFMRLYLQQCEALRKLRNGGNQTVTINHNHIVTDKAIIGDVYGGRG